MTNKESISLFSQTFPFLSPEDITAIREISTYRFYKNKETIVKEGENTQRVFFLLKGMIRGYFINKKGEEKNIFLRPELTMTGAPDSLFQNKPTKYTFEAILEAHLMISDYQKLKTLAFTNPRIGQFFVLGLQENILTLISRVEALIDKSPEERYEDLLEQSPQFFQTAFNKHIANYLGITAVSLSRIIKRRKER